MTVLFLLYKWCVVSLYQGLKCFERYIFLIRMISVTSITNRRRHIEDQIFSYCLNVILRTLYQLSVHSDCVFSEQIYHDDIVYLKNSKNYYVVMKWHNNSFNKRNTNHSFSTRNKRTNSIMNTKTFILSEIYFIGKGK